MGNEIDNKIAAETLRELVSRVAMSAEWRSKLLETADKLDPPKPEAAIEQCKRLRKALDTILMLDPAAEDAAFLAVTVAAEALDE